MNKYALLIACSYTFSNISITTDNSNMQQIKPLNSTKNDIRIMSNVLQSKGFNVCIMTDFTLDKTNQLYPTYKNVIRELKNNLLTSDKFIFYFSGHSSVNSLLLGNGETLDKRELQSLLEQSNDDLFKLLIMDCCYGGIFLENRYKSLIKITSPSKGYINKSGISLIPKIYPTFHSTNKIVQISGCGYSQYSYSASNMNKNGALTKNLCKCIKNGTCKSHKSCKSHTIQSMMKFILDNVVVFKHCKGSRNNIQIPFISSSFKLDLQNNVNSLF